MLREKIYHFEKKNKYWDNLLIYKIDYDENKNKCLYFILETIRLSGENEYYDWAYKLFNENNGICMGTIAELTEWGDIDYGIMKKWGNENVPYYNEEFNEHIRYEEPEPVYNFVNDLIEQFGGVEFKSLYSLNEKTPCGFYYM